MTKALLGAAFLVGVFALPWFATLLIAILYLAEGGNAFVVIFGGFVMDELTAAPVASLHGFAFLYTFLAVAFALVTLYLRQMLFE
jgi:hypothetical protein